MTGRTPPRRVGVLGGTDPTATIMFMQRVHALTPARSDADHIPLIVDSNTQLPSPIAALVDHRGHDPTPALVAMGRKLEAYGAAALAIPCHAAHSCAGPVRETVTIPVLDMIALSAEVAGKISRSARVGLLASPATRLARVYDEPMQAAGLIPIWPRDDADVLDAIRALKRAPREAAAHARTQRLVRELATAGAGAVLVAGTEFSLAYEELETDTALIDTIDVLAAATVAFAQSA